MCRNEIDYLAQIDMVTKFENDNFKIISVTKLEI